MAQNSSDGLTINLSINLIDGTLTSTPPPDQKWNWRSDSKLKNALEQELHHWMQFRVNLPNTYLFVLFWFYGISTFFSYLIPNPFLYKQTVLFQVIKFSISILFSSIWPIDKTLSGATTPGQSEPGSDGNEWVLRIPQSSSITGTSSSDCSGHSLGVGVLPLCREAIGVFYSPSRLCNQYIC